VKDYIERGFRGVKLYPPPGYKPYDEEYATQYPELLEIYAYLESEQIPIAAHCTPYGLGGYPHKDKDGIFADPDNYEYLLEKYTNLKLCLAHFGGNSEWRDYLERPWEKSCSTRLPE
jgi:predicted TIM-barrel fold metal-dependent hydrolase